MLTLLSSLALAAEPAWTVQVDPLTAALGYAHVQVERRLTDHASLYAGPHLRLYDGLLSDGHGPYIGLGVELGARWYPWGAAPRGPWLLARGVVARASTTQGPRSVSAAGYGSVLAGATAILDDRWVLAGGAGVQRIAYTVGGYGVDGWFPAAHTAVGIAF